MNDLFGREKFAHLPGAISNEGKRIPTPSKSKSKSLVELVAG
jgi:hypothetical protein